MASMNGFAHQGIDESAFGEKPGGLRSFDAFPKTKPTYTRRSTSGGYATVFLVIASLLLSFSEFRRWCSGEETQQFSVQKGVSHTMQINIDATIKMNCQDLHVNVQDASGDRILAGEMLKKDPTSWTLWTDPRLVHLLGASARQEQEVEEDSHAGHVLGEVRRGNRKFPKTPKLGRRETGDACRIYGSLEGNKVQGDFHITARGHGYIEFAEHLPHEKFNFSHVINELSFGPHYPSLLNPLDNTLAATEKNFYRFQYYLSIVPTVFTRSKNPTLPANSDPALQAAMGRNKNTVMTNQYAVTSQSRAVPENVIPGIFFKFDIEPILLTITDARGSFLFTMVRIINVVSGILVGGGWIYQLWDWGQENVIMKPRRRRTGMGEGMLHGRKEEADEGHHDD